MNYVGKCEIFHNSQKWFVSKHFGHNTFTCVDSTTLVRLVLMNEQMIY